MKTLMKFGAVAAVALACGAASADYLYALVDGAYYYYNGEHPEFDYLTVKVDGVKTPVYLADGIDTYYKFPSDPDDKTSSRYAPDGNGFYVPLAANGSYQTFLFEMFNDNNSTERVAWQEFTYEDVKKHVFKEGGDTATDTPLVISRVVPEPTSALLSLFGLAALALRRRKMA